MSKFKPSPNKEPAKQALREGMKPEDCATEFNISLRTVWRYLIEVKNEPRNIEPHSGNNTIRIFREDYDLLKRESEAFDLPIAEIIHYRMAWYRRNYRSGKGVKHGN